MNKTVSSRLLLLVVAASVLVVGCSGQSQPQPEDSTGSAHFTAAIQQMQQQIGQQAVSAEDVARVTVTLTAADIPSITIDLSSSNGVWGGTINRIRAGTGRTFTAEAFDADGKKLFEGQATNVTIEKDKSAKVFIMVQPLDKPAIFENQAPIIDSLIISAGAVEPGGVISLRAAAHDPNPADTALTYAWTATGGSFDVTDALTTIWTAPAEEGTYTLTLKVIDPHDSTAALSIPIRAQAIGRGSANIEVAINTWPQVTRVTALPTRVNVGEAMTVEAMAADVDGNALSYHWIASCSGSWADENTKTARFTPSVLPGGACNNCKLTVAVSDGKGGSTTGSLDVCVSRPTPVNYPPTVESAYQSQTTVTAGDAVRLYLLANDPQGKPMNFSWSANVGILGTPVHSGNTSEVRWTAPVCINPDVTPAITVTVTNAAGLSATNVYTLAWNGERCDASTSYCFAPEAYEGHWLFETTFYDSSANLRHLNTQGGTTWVSDAIWGNGVHATGGDIAQRPSDDAAFDFGNRDFAVMTWVRRTNTDSYIISKSSDPGSSQGWSLRSYYGRLYWYSPIGNLSSLNTLDNGVWQHVAITRSGNTLTIYIDGVADNSRTLSGAIPDTDQPLRLGGHAGSTGMNGSLDEVVILNRAATSLEVASAASRSCR